MQNESESALAGLHRRFDSLQANVELLHSEGRKTSERLIIMDARIDKVEIQAKASEERERLIYESLKDAVGASNNMIKKLFDKFDAHTHAENDDRKKMLFWILTTAVSAIVSLSLLLAGKLL